MQILSSTVHDIPALTFAENVFNKSYSSFRSMALTYTTRSLLNINCSYQHHFCNYSQSFLLITTEEEREREREREREKERERMREREREKERERERERKEVWETHTGTVKPNEILKHKCQEEKKR